MKHVRNRSTSVTVTEAHLKLLGRLVIGYDDWTEFGAPEVDPKRPYGNSDVYSDMAEILGCTEDETDLMDQLHHDLETVLQILVRNLGIEAGTYVRSDPYSKNWTKA